MGYYTYFELTVSKGLKEAKKQISQIDKATEKLIAKDLYKLIFNDADDDTLDSVKSISEDVLMEELKWYNHDYDVKTLSKKYPDLYFTLYGEGESGEVWLEIYKSGEIIYEKEIEKGDFF